MRVLVIGASGRTGQLLIEAARAHGHKVRAFSKAPLVPAGGVEVLLGDVLNETDVARAVTGCDAVLCALGPVDGSPSDLCTRGTKNVIAAMKHAGVRRLVCITGALIGHPRERLGFLYRHMQQRLEKHGALTDRREQERLVQTSGLDWTLVRPPRLSNRGPDRVVCAGENLHIDALASVSRRGLATFMVEATVQPRWSQRAVAVLG